MYLTAVHKMILGMMRQMLSLVEKIPCVPAAILSAKAMWGARLRGRVLPTKDQQIGDWFNVVRHDGVCAVKNFLTAETCVRLQSEIKLLMDTFPDAVQIDRLGADRRIFLGKTPPGQLANVFADERLGSCASAVLGVGAVNLATLAGHLTAVPGNAGSGGGWHRDSFTNQFKAMIYLSDVGPENGPFQYMRGSHLLRSMIHDQRAANLGVGQARIGEDQVEKLLNEKPHRLATVTGLAGTLILADTTGIHRGMPIKSGERYALTNYFYPARAITAALTDHFRPVVGVHTPYKRAANSSIESI